MTAKNAVQKTWSIVPSGDGRKYSAYPSGNKPGFGPLIVQTDIIDGPISGGESNNGCYLTLIGWNLGTFADWGTKNHLYIGGHEVANYRCLVKAVGDGSGSFGRGVYETFGLMRLTVQVGSLGGSLSFGTAYPITLSINGVTPDNPTDGSGNYLALGDGKALTFTPTQGTIVFVDPVNGNNANAGTFASPKKDLQTSTGFGGALPCATGSNQTNGTPAGQHTVLMGGTYAATGTTATGNYGMWANLLRVAGTQPAAGLKKGNIVITSYPGAAGANSPQTAHYNPGTGVSASGGFLGPDQARASATGSDINPYDGLAGWGRDIVFSNIRVTAAPDGPRDGAPFNLNSSSDRVRIVNCQASWLSTSTGVNGAKAGCVAGNGLDVLVACNYFHDVSNGDGQNQNHFIYFDGSVICANRCTVSFNCMRDNSGGNGVQTYNSQASDYIQNIVVHNNWIENVNKHALNCADNTKSRTDFNNVCLGAGESLVNFNPPLAAAANSLKVFNNTLVDWGTVLATRTAAWNQGATGTGCIDMRNNIIARRSTATGTGGFNSGVDTTSMSYNRWYDATGHAGTTAPDSGAHGSYGDPSFNASATKDFSLIVTSACIDAGTTPLVARTFDFLGGFITGTNDQGAYEYGALQ